MKKIIAKIKAKIKKISTVALPIVALGATKVFATEASTPALDIDFDTAEMFSWAQTMISAMMPVVYIIMGVALGFLIINAFKRAFN